MNRIRLVSVLVCLAVVCATGIVFGQVDRGRPGRGRRASGGRNLRAGDEAPNFELPRLDPFFNLEEDDSDPAVEMVELASLRGQKPVALFFSSYT